ncbi:MULTISPECIES: class A beta-lactamase [Methylosinus]|uniref:Beta-lactamase n=1 Tax=Methylosinus sporium TaxID=428 RepID=A0A2U1SNZ8_METSR|nr:MULTISPECIES: class A beta-lactamase [Methylosinus]MBU3887326.1 class A beta-lactamase [Methylosinus sp. KRF6]PWB93336.1 class A beta-lactamase [Methylosinus sporium]TRL30742.1 class A beta-lactamase [Methylosinus sporium]
MNRRRFLLCLAASGATPFARAADAAELSARVEAIERRAGGRLGVAVLSGDGRRFAHRADERFPMCSTFKALAVAAVLKRIDAGALSLERKIAYGQADLLDYAPATRAHVADGAMSLRDLCAAAMQLSDNTAANLILGALGGPQAVTETARSLGDEATRLDRDEPTLNSAIPGDPRDTTTPMAMARDLRELIMGRALSETSRLLLEDWMIGNKTGAKRLRAGLPPDWGVGDKTGSGENGAANTIAIFRPPRRAPLFVAVYLAEAGGSKEERDAVHHDVAKSIAETF